MKKLVLMAFAAIALAFASVSCTSKTEKEVESPSTLKSVIENCSNTDSIAMYVEKAKAYAQKLVNEGKLDEAKKYLAEIEPVVKAKAPALASTLSTVNAALDKAEATLAKDKAEAAVDSLKDAASDAVNAAKDKASDAVDAAKDKASDAVDAAKEKASDAAQQGADKVKDLLK